MERAFSAKKEKDPASSSVQDASDRITRRGETIDDKIKKLDAELSRYKEQIKKMRPGPAQEAKKARAMRMLKQKRTYEGQRDMLCSESFKLDQVACAVEGIKDKDAQQNLTSLKYASKDLKGMVKIIKIHGIDSLHLQDEMTDLMDVTDEWRDTRNLWWELQCT